MINSGLKVKPKRMSEIREDLIDDIKAKYGPMGLLMARADSAYFTVIGTNGDLTWMEIRRSP